MWDALQGFALIDKIDNKYEDEILLKRLRPVTEASVPPSSRCSGHGRVLM